MSGWVTDVINDIAKYGGFGIAGDATQAAGQATGLGGFTTVIAGVWANLRDYKMWRSLGWLLLGVVLMLLAVGWWIGPSAARRSPMGLAAEGLG